MQTKTLAIRGVMFNTARILIAFTVTLFLTPFLIHRLGDGNYGIWTVVMGLVGYYGLLDVGLRDAGTKYISQFLAVNDRPAADRAIFSCTCLYALLAVLALVVAGVVAWVAPFVLSSDWQSDGALRGIILLTGAAVSVQLIGQMSWAALAALKRFDLINFVTVGTQLLQAALIVTVVLAGGDLLGMAVVFFLVAVVHQTLQIVLALFALGGISFSRGQFDLELMKCFVAFGLRTFVISGGKRITDYAGTLIIGGFLGPVFVTFFSIADVMVRKALALGRAVGSVVMPVSSQLEAQQKQDALRRMLVIVPRVLMSAALFLATEFLLMGHSLIELWIGPGYAERVFPVLCLLTVVLIVRMPTNSLRSMLIGMGRVQFLSRLTVVECALTVGLGLVLVPAMGIVGMAWAVLVPQVVAYGGILPVFACRTVGSPWPQFAMGVVVPAGLSALPGLAVAVLLKAVFEPHSLLVLLGQIGCVAVVSIVSAFFICLDAELARDVRTSVFSLFRRQPASPDAPVASEGAIGDD